MFVRALLVVVFAFTGAIGGATAAHADTSDFTFDSFDAQYSLSQNADGTSKLDVVETIVARFPDFDQNRGIIRAIPAVNQDIPLFPVVHSVVDDKGNDVYFEEADAGEFIELALGTDDFVYGKTTYVISYSLSNVVTTYTEPQPTDEFYWDVNGTGWAQPFGKVSATLRVDPELVDDLSGNTACFAGGLGEQEACELRVGAGETQFATTVSNLDPAETLTVIVGFTEGTFVQGEKIEGTWDGSLDSGVELGPAPLWADILSWAFIAGSLGMLAIAIRKRVAISRSSAGRGIIVPQYSVPEGLNPMVAAALVGRNESAFAAQLVSLAVRKKLRILDYPVTASGAEYSLQFLDSTQLDSLEEAFVTAIFGKNPEVGEVRELSPGDASLGRSVNLVLASAKHSLSTLGLRDPKKSMGCGPLALTFGFASFTGIASFTISMFTVSFSMLAIVATFIAFVVFLVVIALTISAGQGALTPLGREKADYLEGMKVYLQLAEKDRFRMLQSPEGAERINIGDTREIVKLYEKLLPFAVLWGIEDEWVKELLVHSGEESPDWYQTTNGFSAAALSSTLRGASSHATYTPSQSWTGTGGSSSSSWSSGSAGSFGGGFSGGGGGGGGGGGR